jgi:hypothetical protein
MLLPPGEATEQVTSEIVCPNCERKATPMLWNRWSTKTIALVAPISPTDQGKFVCDPTNAVCCNCARFAAADLIFTAASCASVAKSTMPAIVWLRIYKEKEKTGIPSLFPPAFCPVVRGEIDKAVLWYQPPREVLPQSAAAARFSRNILPNYDNGGPHDIQIANIAAMSARCAGRAVLFHSEIVCRGTTLFRADQVPHVSALYGIDPAAIEDKAEYIPIWRPHGTDAFPSTEDVRKSLKGDHRWPPAPVRNGPENPMQQHQSGPKKSAAVRQHDRLPTYSRPSFPQTGKTAQHSSNPSRDAKSGRRQPRFGRKRQRGAGQSTGRAAQRPDHY